MKYIQSNLLNKSVSNLGFGGWQLGNNDMWTGTTHDDGVELVKEAIKKGVTFFDTAPGYGNGESERIIGEGIKGHREDVIINTKFGHSASGVTDFSVNKIEAAIYDSLTRLDTNYLDSMILHNPPREILEGSNEHCEEFKKLKKLGLVKACGVSVDTLEELILVLNNLEVDIIEVMFNIIHQEVISVFDEIQKRGILLVIKVPLDSGWLTGKYDKDSEFTGVRSRWSAQDKKVRGKLVKRIKKIVREDDLVPTALSFILSYKAVSVVIPGTKNSEQLDSNIMASESILDFETKQELIELFQDHIQGEDIPW